MDTPDIVVIHGGCNHISSRQSQERLMEEEIVTEIISIGSYCRDKGVNKIMIKVNITILEYGKLMIIKSLVLKINFISSITQKSREIIYSEM